MPDLEPIRATTEVDISSMQVGFSQLAQSVQEAVEKIKGALTEASSHTHQKTAEVEKETNNLSEAFKKLGTNVYENIHTPFGEIHERFTGFIEELSGTTLAIGGTVAAIAVLGHELSEMSDEFAQTARQLQTQATMFSLSTESMQVFGEAAKQVGQSSQSIIFGLRSLERVFETNSESAAEFGGSNAKASSILKEYGLTTGTVQEKLEKFIKVLHDTNDEGDRHRLILELIGARGLQLLPVLEQMADKGYENIKEEMKELNVLLDKNAIKTGTDAYEANLKLSNSWEGLKNRISVEVAPTFTALNNTLADTVAWLGKQLKIVDDLKEGWHGLAGMIGGMYGTMMMGPVDPSLKGADKGDGQNDRQKMDALLSAIKEADAEGKKHQKTLLEHAAALRAFAREFGETAPSELKKFINQLAEIDEATARHGATLIAHADRITDELVKKYQHLNIELKKEDDKYVNENLKRVTEENKKELDERTKEVLKYIKTVHDLAQEDLNQAEAIGKIKLKGEEDNVKFMESTHKISFDKAIQMRKELAREELKLESDKIEAEIKLAELSPDSDVKVKQLNDKRLQLEKEYNLKVEQLDHQSIQNRQKNLDNFLKSMQSGMDTAINGWLQGTQSLSQAWVKTLDGMLVGLARVLEQMLMRWLEHLIMKDALSQSFSIKESLRTAYAAAKAAFKSAMDLPVPVNFVMAPIMAAAAFAGTMELGSAAGGMVVPHDNYPAFLHAREWVLPANISQGLQGMINSGKSGGGMVIHSGAISIHSSATNSKDLVRELIPEMQRAMRLGKFS